MTDHFDETLAQYLAARDYLNDLPRDVQVDEEKRAGRSYYSAYRSLVRAEAKTAAQVRAQGEVILASEGSEASADELLSLLADIRRLDDNHPSAVFSPSHWLDGFQYFGGGWIEREGEVILLVPENKTASDCMFELEAHGGREQVFALIRERARPLQPAA